jgi:DUF971 family protein
MRHRLRHAPQTGLFPSALLRQRNGEYMQSSGKTNPADIEVHIPDRTMTIQWGDEHRSVYPFDLLRKECPCAVCREASHTASNDPFKVVTSTVRPGEVTVTGAEQVGRYAVRFEWTDGHNTGIYSYEYLRAICPCEQCQKALSS